LALFGMGGVGKTQIAIEYVVQFETQYEGVYWITAETMAQLLSGFVSIANETRCTETASRSQTEIAQAVLSWLYRTKDWLLVVDNLDDISIANGYLPRLNPGGGHVLITTRNPNSINIPAEGLKVDIYDPEEGKELLLRRAQLADEMGTGSATEVEALEIVRSLGFLALAIEQAAAYIREELGNDIFKFQSIYSVRRRQFLDRETTGNTYYKNNVATTWLISMDVVERKNPRASQLLRLFAFMNSDGITLDFLQAAENVLSKKLQFDEGVDFNASLLRDLRDLEQFSLISRQGLYVTRIHRLVQSVIKDRMSTDEVDAYLSLICEVGLCAFPFFTHEMRMTCRKYESEIVPIVSGLGDRTTERASELLYRVGVYFGQDGKYNESVRLLSNAVNMRKSIRGEEHPVTLSTMHGLANSYWSLGKLNEAAEIGEKVLEARRRILGEEHPDTLWIMHGLAYSHWSLGKLNEAAEIGEKVLEARRRILGEEHPDTLSTMHNLANSCWSLGKVKEAAGIQEKVLGARRRILGEEHPDTLWIMHGLAYSYWSLGKVKEAAGIQEKVLEARRRILGEEHPHTLRTMHDLANSYGSLGKVKEAAGIQEKVLEAQRRILGEEHHHTLRTMQSVASSYWSLGKVKEAAEIQEKVLEARRRILGEEHPDTLLTMHNLANSYGSLGKVKEAAEIQEKVLEAQRRILGEEHPDTLSIMQSVASSYWSLGKVKEAAGIQEKVLEAQRRILGEEHPHTLRTMHNLAFMYRFLERSEATELDYKVHEIRQRLESSS